MEAFSNIQVNGRLFMINQHTKLQNVLRTCPLSRFSMLISGTYHHADALSYGDKPRHTTLLQQQRHEWAGDVCIARSVRLCCN